MTCAFSCTQMILRFTSVSSLLTGKTKRLLYARCNIVWSRFVTGWRGIILRGMISSFQPWNHSHQAGRLHATSLLHVPSVGNIGVVFDSGMSMGQQVTRVCQTAYWQLHTISTMHSSITLDAALKLVLALVVSWRFAQDGVTTLARS